MVSKNNTSLASICSNISMHKLMTLGFCLLLWIYNDGVNLWLKTKSKVMQKVILLKTPLHFLLYLMHLRKSFNTLEEHEEGVLTGHYHVLVETFRQGRQQTLQDCRAPVRTQQWDFPLYSLLSYKCFEFPIFSKLYHGNRDSLKSEICKQRSSLDKWESLVCQITSPFINELGGF